MFRLRVLQMPVETLFAPPRLALHVIIERQDARINHVKQAEKREKRLGRFVMIVKEDIDRGPAQNDQKKQGKKPVDFFDA